MDPLVSNDVIEPVTPSGRNISHHPAKRSPTPGFILAVLGSHFVEFFPGFQLGQSLQTFSLLLAQDVADIHRAGASSFLLPALLVILPALVFTSLITTFSSTSPSSLAFIFSHF